jgi:hypothetical protein
VTRGKSSKAKERKKDKMTLSGCSKESQVLLPELQCPDSLIGKEDVRKAVDAPGKFQDHIPAMVNNPGRHIEKPIAVTPRNKLFERGVFLSRCFV